PEHLRRRHHTVAVVFDEETPRRPTRTALDLAPLPRLQDVGERRGRDEGVVAVAVLIGGRPDAHLGGVYTPNRAVIGATARRTRPRKPGLARGNSRRIPSRRGG